MQNVAVTLLLLGAARALDQAVALHDYIAREADELSFARGDRLLVVSVTAEGEEGWGVARHADGREGLLPLDRKSVV